MTTFAKANAKDATTIQALAFAIWPKAYDHILSTEQLQYMLQKIYNVPLLTQQIISGEQHYFLIQAANDNIGFFGLSILPEQVLKINKLYVHPQTQGAGVGRQAIQFITQFALKHNCQLITLNVNRFNTAKLFYEKLGFTVTAEEDIDIGNGYFMNDYILDKKIEPIS
jgi:diamine N-acetyltransferase